MTTIRLFVKTQEMADLLGIHSKTLLRLRKKPFSPFKEGIHYRYGGLTTGAPLQWFPEITNQAFTEYSFPVLSESAQ